MSQFSTYDQKTDHELMRLVQKCDQRAMLTIYERHYTFVTGILKTYCCHADDIDRAYNSIMLQVWQNSANYWRRNFPYWLHKLCCSEARSYIAKQQKKAARDGGNETQTQWRKLNECLQSLPKRQRQFVQLCVGTGDVQQAAAIMGIGKESADLLWQKVRSNFTHYSEPVPAMEVREDRKDIA